MLKSTDYRTKVRSDQYEEVKYTLDGILKEFLTVDEISEYLNIKKSTVYSMVESGKIPCYRFGRLIRVSKQDTDDWIKERKEDPVDPDKKANQLFKSIRNRAINIESTIKKIIEEEKDMEDTPNHGRPDRIKSLREEVSHGSL